MGVPVEGVPRALLGKNNVKDMAGYESYPSPLGTWSDDSSLALSLAQSLVEKKGVDLHDIGEKFVKWLYEGYWTPFCYAFVIGFTTKIAIERITSGIYPSEAGPDDEYSNGNGSLMIILPLAYYIYNKNLKDQFEITHSVSRITHGHVRSQMACGIFIQLAVNLLWGHPIKQSYENTVETRLSYYSVRPYKEELPHFERILKKTLLLYLVSKYFQMDT